MSAPLIAYIILHGCSSCCRYRGFYMTAHVLMNLLNKLGKRDKM